MGIRKLLSKKLLHCRRPQVKSRGYIATLLYCFFVFSRLHRYAKHCGQVFFCFFVFLFFCSSSVFAYWPGDVYYGEQWYLRQIKAQQAWDFTRGSEEVIVAVLDSGIDLKHPDLKDNIWINKNEIVGDGIDNDRNGYIDDVYGWNFISNNNNPNPILDAGFSEVGVNHGTIIAGIIGARGDNGKGIAGVNWHSKIMALKVLDSNGNGNTGAAVQAIDYAIRNGADIINMSFVGQDYSKAMYEAIERAWNSGLVIVAATGNDLIEHGENLDKNPNYPAGYDGSKNMVIGVTAVDKSDKKAIFSNFGRDFIDIAAPGVDFFSTVYHNSGSKDFSEYYKGYWSGSSVSTALVSGVASLVKSLNFSLSNEKIRDIILGSADDIDFNNPEHRGQLGTGRLNGYKTLNLAYQGYFNVLAGKDILAGAGRGRKPEVKILDSQGVLIKSFLAYAPGFRGGVRVVGCDLDNDNVDEIITGAGQGGGPHVRIFNKNGEVINQFFAYDKNFRGGVQISCGDVNGDGKNEIITGAGIGGGPHVRIFNKNGEVLSQFFAYNDRFRGGVNVAVRDLNKDGKAEILTGPASMGGPQVRIFNYDGSVVNQFFAFSPDFRGGIDVSAGDLNGDKKDEIVVTITNFSAPYVRIFDSDLKLSNQFLAFDGNLHEGINAAVEDLESDGIAEIIIGPVSLGNSSVLVYNANGKKLSNFSVFEKEFKGGVDVGAVSGD